MNSFFFCLLAPVALCCVVCLQQQFVLGESSFVSASASESESDSNSDDDDHSLRLIARANDHFCFALLRQLEEAELERAQLLNKEGTAAPGNLFISPLSISSLLVMLMAGAGNETYSQIRNALGFDAQLSEAEIFSTYSHLLQHYQHYLNDTTTSSESSFSETSELTYSNAVEHQPDQSMLLLNDNHFTGFWKRRFYKEFTQLKSFTSADGQTSQVPTMHRYFARENFAKFEDGELLELPLFFASSEKQPEAPLLSMFIFLPNESAAKGSNSRLISEQFESFGVTDRLDELLPWKVDIEVPRFSVASSYQLKGALQELGVKAVFSQGADFSRFYEKASKTEADLRLTDLMHRSRIEVQESGAEADSSTSSLVAKKEKKSKRPLSQPRRVSINRRFLFLIRDTTRQLTLFAGVVNKIQ